MFFINFKIILRKLQKNKFFSLLNIGGLAIGLTCCLLLLLYVNYEWSYDKQFEATDHIYMGMLNSSNDGQMVTHEWTPSKLAPATLQRIPGIELAARINRHSDHVFSHKNHKFRLHSLFADPSFLKIFNYKTISGALNNALNGPNSVVFTASTAKKLFGDEDPIGQTVRLNSEEVLTVMAVIADLPKNQTFQFDALLTQALYAKTDPQIREFDWGMISCQTVFKLKENASFKATDAVLRKMIKENDPESHFEAFLFPFSHHHLYNKFDNGKNSGGKIDQVRLFLFLAFCVLLIACINYINLTTAQSEKRLREVGLRKTLGSTRAIIMQQFVLESLLFSIISMTVAFILLELSLPYFNNLLDIAIQIDYSSYLFWLTLISLTLLTGFLAGFYPAFYLSSFKPIKVVKKTGSFSSRKVLVVIQFTLSIALIVCASIIYSQIQFMKNRPLGFEENNLVQLNLEGEFKNPDRLSLFKTELRKSQAILYASEIGGSLLNAGHASSGFVWPGKESNEYVSLQYRCTGFDYVKTVGAKLLMGRDFSPEFVADTSTSVLLNEAAVKRMGLKNPVGSTIRWDNSPPLTVIGVIKNYANHEAGSRTLATVYYNNSSNMSTILLKLNPAQPLSASIKSIKELSYRLNPSFPPDLQFIDEMVAEKLKNEKLLSVLSNLFGGFCIFISCLGLLALALYRTEQRKKEISIRKVLGADVQSLLLLLNKDFLKLVVISNLIAFPIAYSLAARWLQKYDYRIDITIWPFLFSALLSVIIALLTISFQTFKVAKSNAVDALKYE